MPFQTYDPKTRKQTTYLGEDSSSGIASTETIPQDNTSVITADSLKPASLINLPTQKPDDNNYLGVISGGASSAAAALKAAGLPPINQEASKTSQDTSLSDQINQLLGSGNAPQSGADLYESVYGKGATAQELEAKQIASANAQKELDILNAQLQGLSAEAQAVPLQVQQESRGRGVTAAGVAPLQSAKLRDIALRSLPLQGQVLAAQAIATNSANLLNIAQQKFNQVFSLRQQDIQNQYDYQKDVRDKVWTYLTDKEKTQLTQMQKEDDRKYKEKQDNLNLAQQWVTEAMRVGASDVASQLTQLNPDDPNFIDKLGQLQSQIVSKQEATKAQEEEKKLIMEGYTKITGPSQLKGLTEDEILRMPNGDIYKKPVKAITMETPSIADQLKAAEAGYIIGDDGKIVKTGETGDYGGQCGDYVHTIVDNVPALGNLWEQKQARSNVDLTQWVASPQVGDVVIQETNMPYGHVSVVTAVENGKITVSESNLGLDEKIGSRVMDVNDPAITGIYRGGKLKQTENKFDKFSQEQIALSVLPVQTRNSEKELERALEGINAGLEQGLNPYQIADNLMGYKINNPDGFSENIRGYISQSENISGSDPAEYARLINSGNKGGVVKKIESSITKGTDTQQRESTARYTYELAPQIYIEILAIEDKFGLVAGNWEKLKKKVSASKEFQKVSSELTAYVQEWRRQMSGTATTPTELKMIDELLPSVTDNPINLKEKIKVFAEMQLNLLNSRRTSLNLPALDNKTLQDYNARVGLYENNDDPLGLK